MVKESKTYYYLEQTRKAVMNMITIFKAKTRQTISVFTVGLQGS